MTALRTRLIAAIATTFVLAACGEQPTSVTAPDRAFYDGGYTFGGGNRSDTTKVTASSGEDAVANSGGYTFGGGN